MSTTRDQIHTDAMEPSAAFYDALINDAKPLRASTLNSCSPFWTIEGSVCTGMWGPFSDFTRHARTAAESYKVTPRTVVHKYPQAGLSGQSIETFCEVEVNDPKSFVIPTVEIRTDFSLTTFAMPREEKLVAEDYEDEDKDAYDEDEDDGVEDDGDQHHQDGQGEIEDEAEKFDDEFGYMAIKCAFMEQEKQTGVTRKKTRQSGPTCRYRLVSQDDLNARYNEYLLGDIGPDVVIDDIVNHVMRKIDLGSQEFDLRKRGEDILGDFWQRMRKAVVDKSFKGQNGAVFANYVSKAWVNHRNSEYRRLEKHDEKYVSSTPWDSDETDDDGYEMHHASKQEDEHAYQLYRQDNASGARERAIRLQDAVRSIPYEHLPIVEDILAGEKHTEIAKRLNMSRHQVYRVTKALKKSLKRVNFRHKMGSAA